jgi:type VI protein secretion system component VasK
MSTTTDDAPSVVRAYPLDHTLLVGVVLAVILVAIYGTFAVSAAANGAPLHPWVHVIAVNLTMIATVALVARWWRRRSDRQAAEIVRHVDDLGVIVAAAVLMSPAYRRLHDADRRSARRRGERDRPALPGRSRGGQQAPGAASPRRNLRAMYR